MNEAGTKFTDFTRIAMPCSASVFLFVLGYRF
jgi:hypothetical protein